MCDVFSARARFCVCMVFLVTVLFFFLIFTQGEIMWKTSFAFHRWRTRHVGLAIKNNNNGRFIVERVKWNQPMTTDQPTATVTTMTGSPRRRRSTFYIPLQATARPILAVARLADAIQQKPLQQCSLSVGGRQQKLTGAGGRALSASALALLQADPQQPSHRPPSSPSSSRRSSPLAFIRRPSSRKLARSSSTIITTGGRWLSSKATAPLRINCSDSSSSIAGGGDTSVVQQANRSPPIIVIEGSPDEFYRRRRRRRRRENADTVGEDGDRKSDDDGDEYDDDDDDDDDVDDDNHSGQCHVICCAEMDDQRFSYRFNKLITIIDYRTIITLLFTRGRPDLRRSKILLLFNGSCGHWKETYFVW